MPYTEIKKRGEFSYHYRCRTVRTGTKFKKIRIYLGKDLKKEKLRKAEQKADSKLSLERWPVRDRSWFFYAAIIVPALNSPVIEAYRRLRKRFPEYTLEWYFTYYGEEGHASGWILSQDDQTVKASKLFDNPSILSSLESEWKIKVKKFFEEIQRLEKIGIKNLRTDFSRFIKRYVDEYEPSLIIESFYMGHERIMNDLIACHQKYKREINYLVEPSKKTFHHQEREDILEIALLMKEGVKEEVILRRLAEHHKRFFWIQNSYKYTDPINIGTFREIALEAAENMADLDERLRFLHDYEKIRESCIKSILEKTGFNRKERIILKWSSELSFWQDQRKKANLIADFWMNEFLKRMSQEYDYTLSELQHAELPELSGLLRGKKIDRKMLRERMKESMHYVDRVGKHGFISGKDADMLKNALISENLPRMMLEIRGTSASPGIAHGNIRLVRDPRKDIFLEGEILVTGMTRPEYLPLMKKAAAVVTDEGGITSHAAIVCRELGIPCIVGCKYASKTLEDGEEVIVNANHGVVRRIKK